MSDISASIFRPDDIFEGENPDIFLPPDPLSLQFRHRTVSGVSAEKDNIEFPWYWSRLDHPALNDRPQAIVTVTPVGRIDVDPETKRATLIQNAHPVGVVFRDPNDASSGSHTGTGFWYVYNLNLQAMASRADFNVAIHEAKRPQ